MAKATGTTPKALLDRPTLKAPYRHHLEAFYELSAGRSRGECPQAITQEAIESHCRMWGLSSYAEREDLMRYTRLLDTAYLNHQIEKINAKAKK